MLNVREALADLRHGVPKTFGEVFVRLEALPTKLVVQRLPVIVDDECRNVNPIVIKVLQRIEDLFFGKLSSKTIPGAVSNTIIPETVSPSTNIKRRLLTKSRTS